MNSGDLKICKNCGAKIPIKANFCPKCGARYIDEELNGSEYKSDKEPDRLYKNTNDSMDDKSDNFTSDDNDSKNINSKKDKPIKWWYSMPAILFCGSWGVDFIPLMIISVIFLVIRLIKTKGISVSHTIRNIILILSMALFIFSAFYGNESNSGLKSPEISETEDAEIESISNNINENNVETKMLKESQTLESDGGVNEYNTSEQNNFMEKNRNVIITADSQYMQDFEKNMTEWEYPDKFRKKREEIFTLIEEAEKLGVSGWNDGYSILVKESGPFDNSLQRTLDDNPDAVTFYYYGDLKDEKPDGVGILFFGINGVYAGNFKKGEPNGYGILYTSNGGIVCESEDFKYVGDHEFKANGDSIKYNMSYEDGANRTPRGKAHDLYVDYSNYYLSDDDESQTFNFVNPLCMCPCVEYEGEMKNNKKDGKGKDYYDVFQISESKEVLWLKDNCYGPIKYDGEYANDQFSGNGTVYFYSGLIEYDGKLKNGLPNGKGKLYDKNGNLIYEGKFKNGDIA